MSIIKLSKKDIVTGDSKDNKIKLKKSDIHYDTTPIGTWEADAKKSFETLKKYQEKLDRQEYFSKDDLKAYESAMNKYIESSNRLRGINKTMGKGFTEEEEKQWNDSVSSMQSGYTDISDYFSKFNTEEEYNEAMAAWKNQETMRAEDVKAGMEEVNSILSGDELTSLKEQKAVLEKGIKLSHRDNGVYLRKYGYDKTTANKKLSELEEQISKIEKPVLERKDYLTQAKYLQNYYYLNENDVSLEEIELHLNDEDPIAYTDPSGKNITWQKLYDDKNLEQDFNNMYEKYSAMPDWAEKSTFVSQAKSKEELQKPEAKLSDFGTNLELEYIHGDDEFRDMLTTTRYGEAARNNSAVTRSLYDYGELYGYDELEDKEKQLATYLYFADKDAYNDYMMNFLHDKLMERHNQAEVQKAYELAQEYPLGSSLVSIGYSLAGGFEFLADSAMGTIDEGNHYAAMSSSIRQGVSDTVDWEIGNWDAFDFVYNTGMSMADSLVANAVFRKAGGIALGLSAAGQGVNDALDRGLTSKQAFWNGVASGTFEMLFESFSLGQFNSLKEAFGSGGKTIAKNIAKSMLVNASEETLTEIANIVYDVIANGDFSNYDTMVRTYTMQGMSVEQAQTQAKSDLKWQVAEAAGSGALMGFGFGAIGSVKAHKNAKAFEGKYDAEDINTIISEGLAVPGSEAYKLAQQAQEKINQGKSLTAQEILDLQNATTKAFTESDLSKMRQAAEVRLTELGEGETAGMLADIIAKQAAGQKLTASEKSFLKNSKYGQRVANEIAPQNIASGDYASGWAENIGTDLVNRDAYNGLYKIAREMLNPQAAEEVAETEVAPTQTEAKPVIPYSQEYVERVGKEAENEYETSAEGKTINKKTDKVVNIKNFDSISESGEANLTLDDGMIVKASDLAYGSAVERAFIEGISSIKLGKNRINTKSANALYMTAMEAWKKNPDMTPSEAMSLVQGLKESYVYGAYNMGTEKLTETDHRGRATHYAGELSQTQRDFAYSIGTQDKVNKIDADQKVIDELKKKAKPKTNKNSKGKIIFEDGINVDESALTKTQKANLEGIKLLSEVSSIEFHIFKSTKVGNTFKYTMPNGTVVSANGWYVAGTNEIWVDLNAGNAGEGTMIRTAAHEISHYIKQWSPKKWQAMADLLMESFAKNGVNTEAMLNRQIDKIKRRYNRHNMPSQAKLLDMAHEEFVSDALTDMLTDGSIVNFIAEVKQKNKNLAQKILDAIKNLLKKWGLIIDDYKGRDLDTAEAQALSHLEDTFKRLQEMYRDAFMDANETVATIGVRNLADFAEAKTTEGEELFQYRAMEADESTYRDMLKKWGKMNDEQIDNLFATIDKAMDIIKDNLEVLDYAWDADIDDRAFSPVKPNSDSLYQVSLDFSTLCRKRILQQTIQAQLQEALNQPLTREEGIAIRDALMALQEEGRQIEVACALCYVESARMKSPAQIKKFLNNREAVLKDFFAGKSGGSMKDKIKQAEIDARKKLHEENPNGIKGKDGTMLDPHTASLKAMPKKYADAIRDAKKGAKESYKPTAEEQELINVANGMNVSDFTSPEGLENLAKNYPSLFDAYTSYVRNATKSKGIEGDTWWRAGDSQKIGDVLIANMNRENGLRSQSWSDFQVIHILDYIAATIELSTRNAKEQAYSKVPDYVELMGQTGVMINMSLIPTREFNGKLDYDSVEGMAYKRALELREKYPATAGTICIGVDNKQIQMLLADSTIDYVIPYHKSGMAASIRKLMHMPTWSEYEDYQSEKNLSRKEAEAQANKYGVKLLSESDPNYHKHTAFSEWFDLEVAKQIAKMENANPTDKAMQKKYGVMYGGYMAMQDAANNYLKLCAERGIAPKFSHENADFTAEDNYWKLLIDRKMVNNATGEIIEQQAIKPIFDEGEVLRILNDELERYPSVKADQEYATRKVTEKFLSGEIKSGMSADAIAKVMKTPVDNIAKTNIVASVEGETMFDEREFDYALFSDSDYYTNGKIYSYDFLTAQKDMVKVKLPDTGFLADKKGKIDDEKVLNEGIKNAHSEGTERDGKVYVKNVYTKRELRIDNSTIKHGLDGTYTRHLTNARIGSVIGSVVKNAIPINGLKTTSKKANGTYAMVSYCHDSRNRQFIAVVTVEQHTGDVDSFELYDVAHAVSGRQKKGSQVDTKSQGVYPIEATNISISDLLQIVNSTHQSILSEDVLTHLGETRNPKGSYANEVLFSERGLAPTFYSQMGKVVEGVKQEKLAANSVVNMLRGKGVKAEEIRWSGIVPFLEGKKSVTKQELLDFINGSMLQIGEKEIVGDGNPEHLKDFYSQMEIVLPLFSTEEIEEMCFDYDGDFSAEKFKSALEEYMEDGDISEFVFEDAVERAEETEGKLKSEGTRWSQYKLDGGYNYREIVFTMPNSSYSNGMMRVHWGEEAEGVLVHARIQDFEANGKNMLFIEEIQSDWHNEGHKNGYESNQDAMQKKITDLEKQWYSLYYKMLELKKGQEQNDIIQMMDAIDEEKESLKKKVDYGTFVPDAPFKDNYHEFVLKRLIRMAAEQGYDSIGWTPADIQSERWSDKYAEGYRIEYDQDMPKFLKKYGRQWGATVGSSVLNNGTEIWSMDITDSMKNSVLYEGQVMYSVRGENTATEELDKQNLETAKKMDEAKVPMENIRLATGWYKQSDGMWRSEFSSKKIKFKPDIDSVFENEDEFKELEALKKKRDKSWKKLREFEKTADKKAFSYPFKYLELYGTPEQRAYEELEKSVTDKQRKAKTIKGKLVDIIYFPELFKLYPQLKDVNVVSTGIFKGATSGDWNKESNTIRISKALSKEQALDTLTHEIQHAIQDIEGFEYEWDKPYLDRRNEKEAFDAATRRKMSDEQRIANPPVMFSERDPSTSNRSILANALEGTAQNDIEKNKLAQYKDKIAQIEAEEKRLGEIQKQLFTKGAVDSAQRKDLQFEAKQIANRINTYDRQLLNLESTTAIKNVLNREKALAAKRQKQKDAEALKQYKEKVAKTTKELMTRHQESRKKAVESREKTATRHKIQKVVGDLNNLLLKPTKERHVPEEMRMAVAEALDLVNMDTVDADTRVAKYNELIAKANDPDVIASLTETRDRILNQGNKMADKLIKLKDAYGMVRDSADDSVRSMYDDVIYNKIESVQKKVGKTPLRNMTLEQLESVYDLYKMVLTTVRDSNKAFAENIKETRMALGSNTFAEIKENNKTRDRIRFEGLERFGWQYLKPMQAIKTIGSGTLSKLWNNILYGQETFAKDYDEAVKFAKEMKEKHGYKKWDLSKTYSFESKSGKAMKINLEQMMSIYAYSKRKQADEHIEYGGIVLNEGIIKEKNKLGKVVEYKVNDSTAYRLDKMQVAEIISTLEKEFPGAKEFVDEMQKYLSETMGAKGNEVSMKMYGINLFKEEHYFPLKSSKEFMEAANAKLKGDVKIKNKGMTKSTVEHARNPIVLEGFLDVWGNHVNEMALYHGLVLPLEDFSRTLNYSFKADEKLNSDAESVRTALHDAFGENADNYLNELLKAINGGLLRDNSAQFADRMISKFKKAKVMASLSVIVQQPTAIIRAMNMIEPKYFIHQSLKHKQTWEELKKYCPTAIIKETGSFDTNMGKTIVDMVKEESNFTEKVGDVLGKAPAYMDEVGWNCIWRALKKKVATEQKLSGEELLQECGKQMTLIINETQVYDSVMARNELMRSKSAFTKMATAFMAEPTTVANMIYGAVLDFKRGKKGMATKTVAATIGSVVINSLVSALVYAMRDDDDDETFLEKYISSATTEVLDGLNPLTYIPFVKDAYSLFQGYDVERTDMALIGDVVDAIDKFYNVLDPEAYEDGMSRGEIASHIWENAKPLLTSICDMFGLPVGNVLRDAEAIIRRDDVPMAEESSTGIGNAFKEGVLDALPKIVGKVIGTDTKSEKLYDAIVSGDTVYLKRLKSTYDDDKAYESAVKKALRENDPRIREAAELRRSGEAARCFEIVDEIAGEKHFSRTLIISAVNAELDKIKREEKENEQ